MSMCWCRSIPGLTPGGYTASWTAPGRRTAGLAAWLILRSLLRDKAYRLESVNGDFTAIHADLQRPDRFHVGQRNGETAVQPVGIIVEAAVPRFDTTENPAVLEDREPVLAGIELGTAVDYGFLRNGELFGFGAGRAAFNLSAEGELGEELAIGQAGDKGLVHRDLAGGGDIIRLEEGGGSDQVLDKVGCVLVGDDAEEPVRPPAAGPG